MSALVPAFDTLVDAIDALAGATATVATSAADALAEATTVVAASAAGAYLTRQEFVTAVTNGLSRSDGATITVADCTYIAKAGSTVISDLPGWVPGGDWTPEHFGVVGDGSDETGTINEAIIAAAYNKMPLLWDNKTYAWQKTYIRRSAAYSVLWRSRGKTVLKSLKTTPDTTAPHGNGYAADAFVYFAVTSSRSDEVTASVSAGDTIVTLFDTDDIVPGETNITLMSSRVIETDNRSEARHGWSCAASRIVNGTQVEMERPAPVTCKVGDITGHTVQSVTSSTIQLDATALSNGLSRTDMMYRLSFPDLPGSPTVLPKDYDPSTGTYTIDTNWGATIPVGMTVGTAVVVERRIDVYLNQPLEVDIGPGFTFERAPTYNATPGDLGYRGLYISRAVRTKVESVRFRGFSEAGLRLNSCFAPRISDLYITGSNRAFDGGDGTGYGVSVSQTSWGVYKDIIGYECRRTLDFIGTQGTSYHNITDNIQGYGGGRAYDGQRFFPHGSTQCTVVGSHGAAFFTQYNNSRGVNVNYIVNLRGSDEIVRGVYGSGKISGLIRSFIGDGVVADGLHYSDGVPDWVTEAVRQYGYPTGKLTSVLVIYSSSIINTKPHLISNIHARGVTRSVVGLHGGGSVGPIIISGAIDLIVDNEEANNTLFYLIRPTDTETPTLNGPILIGKVHVLNKLNAPKKDFYYFGSFTWGPNAYARLPSGTLLLRIENDAVAKIPHFTANAVKFSLRFSGRDRSPNVFINDALIWADRAGDKSPAPNSLNVDILATPPTGATGATGKVSVCLALEGDNTLYIENRYGSAQFFVIDCDSIV